MPPYNKPQKSRRPAPFVVSMLLVGLVCASCTSPGSASSAPPVSAPLSAVNGTSPPGTSAQGDSNDRFFLPDLGPRPGPGSFDSFDLDAKPSLKWSVPGRFAASWAAYDPRTGLYNSSFVNPEKWSINLDACSSTSKRAIKSYIFTIRGDGMPAIKRTSSSCRLNLVKMLPAEGKYLATVTLRTDFGNGSEGVSAEHQIVAKIEDRLIVAMGDSLASGEGNPDVPGRYVPSANWKGEYTSAREITPVTWADRQCHRSRNSGPALAAKSFETEHTSVTFVSAACSGAQIWHLLNTRYEGAEPQGRPTLPPQVEAVAKVVGPDSPRGGRQIDALIIAAGLNDLHFSTIVSNCAADVARLSGNCVTHRACQPEEVVRIKRPGGGDLVKIPADKIGDNVDCYGDGAISDQLGRLPQRYDDLATELRKKLPNASELYINDYPANLFEGGACGKLNTLSGVGIGAKEGKSMDAWGRKLTKVIADSTHRHRSNDERWNGVGSLTAVFKGRQYCSDEEYAPRPVASWFTKYETSWSTQGNRLGTAHPNAAGHVAYGLALSRAIVMDQLTEPYRRMKISVDEIRVDARFIGATTVDLIMREYQADNHLQIRKVPVVRDGKWHAIPDEIGDFVLDVYPDPSSSRRATALFMGLSGIASLHHTLRDGYGQGEHTVENKLKRVSFRYSIILEDPRRAGPDVVVR